MVTRGKAQDNKTGTTRINKADETESDRDLSDMEQVRVAMHGCTRKSSGQQWKVEFMDEYKEK